ncbi:MAG: hypothetical protein H9535_03445 [Ignavibacteria bacterium]|nr:hypothetical protein [Ignavibacteria bacterium]
MSNILIILCLLTICAFEGIGQVFIPKAQIPTKKRLIGTWKNRYDRTSFIVVSNKQWSEIKQGIKISSNYEVFDFPPGYQAQPNEFGEYIWLNPQPDSLGKVPRYVYVKFLDAAGLRIGEESIGGGCINELGFVDFDRVRVKI